MPKLLPDGVLPTGPEFPTPAQIQEAQDPETPPERLRSLSWMSPHLRPLVALNPNTPFSLLRELWCERPETALENPLTELLLLEAPESFLRGSHDLLKKLFALPQLPRLFFSICDSYDCYHDLMATSPALPLEVALRLTHQSSYVQGRLAQNPLITTFPEALDALCRAPSPSVARILSKNSWLPHPQRLSLLRHDDAQVRSNIASQLEASEEILTALFHDLFPQVQRGLAKNPSLPPALVEGLSQHWDSEVRENVALNPNTQPHLLERLARDPIRNVRLAVRENPATPAALRASLQHEPPISPWFADYVQPIRIGDSGKLWKLT